ncbi:hypothetical protein DPMN_150863, partial [Dreissena polymorpha]
FAIAIWGKLPHYLTITIFELSRAIIKTNVLTKFHERWSINVISRVLSFKPNKDIIGTHFLNMFQRQNNIPPPMAGDNKGFVTDVT